MILSLLSWIPLLGPIIQGVSSIFTGYFSKETAVVQSNAQVTVAETQASAQIIHDTNDDICLRILRDALCAPVVVWCMLGTWDTIVAHHWPAAMFVVEKFPPTMAFMPYAVITFLLGNIGLNMWNRK